MRLIIAALVTLSINLGSAGCLPQAAFAQTTARTTEPTDPLPSWNSGPAKAAILDFVARTTETGAPDFVPLAERVAVFDNDGTLWPENPFPFELAFTFDAAKARMAKMPELKADPAYAALAAGCVKAHCG